MLTDGGRGFDFSLASTGLETLTITVDAPRNLFTGNEAIAIQEGAGICYETLKCRIDQDAGIPPRRFTLTSADVAQHRKITKINRLYSPRMKHS
jgi:hypothetical protein